MFDDVVDGIIFLIVFDEKVMLLLVIINLIELYNVKVVVLKLFCLGGIDKV